MAPPRLPKDPNLGGGGGTPPAMLPGMKFADVGSYGLKAFSGWVREEFLPQLQGRQAARVYREMLDNSSTVGSMIFAVTQTMRKVQWRVEPANDSPAAEAEAEFAESLMHDMSHTWEDFISEALTMLGYGFSIHEIVYKRRHGPRPQSRPGPRPNRDIAASKFTDGRIGWRRLPIRGQDTILKWFFDANGQPQGVTQQPYIGPMIDLPIEKCLLLRPGAHKGNPEGRSVLRNAYRGYYFVKRLEELESVLFERMCGFPVMYIPSEVIEKANGPTPDPNAAAMLAAYKKLVTNMRLDEQMGAVIPSNVWPSTDGKLTSVRMFELALLTPQGGGAGKIEIDTTIGRHKIDMLMTLLCDFIQMGHEVRGTNNLAVTKVDMFYAAIEGWLNSIAAVMNHYALPRIFDLNGISRDLLPEYAPDMATRLDLDSLGAYIANLATAGMPIFPNEELQTFLLDAGGMPDITSPEATAAAAAAQAAQAGGGETIKAMLKAAMAKRILKTRSEATPC